MATPYLSQILGITTGIIIFLFGGYRAIFKSVSDGMQTMSLGFIPLVIGLVEVVSPNSLGISGAISAYSFLLCGILGSVWYIRDNIGMKPA